MEIRSSPGDARCRILVISHEGLSGEALERTLADRQSEGGADVHVVVPALAPKGERLASDVDEARESAQASLDRLLRSLEADGRELSGSVGDSDPRLALEDALREFSADEVLVVNPPDAEKGPSERDATKRAFDDVPVPVTEVTSTTTA